MPEVTMPLLHRAKVVAGIGLCAYEAAALAAGQPEALPRLTDLAHRHPWLGRFMAGWCVVHLAIPGLWTLVLMLARRVLH